MQSATNDKPTWDALRKVHYAQYPFFGSYCPEWGVEDVRLAIASHEAGNFQQSSYLAESILRDPSTVSALESRIYSALSVDVSLEPSDGEDYSGARSYAAKEAEKLWKSMMPKHVLESALRSVVLFGFALLQVKWDKKWNPELCSWFPQNVCFRYSENSESSVAWFARSRTGEVSIEEHSMHWCFITPGGKERAWMDGLVRSLGEPWVAGQYALRDWLRYSERHGMPLLKAFMPSGANLEDKAAFVSGLQNMGSNPVVALPQAVNEQTQVGYDLQIVEATASTWQGFKSIIDDSKSVIRSRILGSDIDAGGGGLGSGQADAKEEVRIAIALRDMEAVLDAVYIQVLRPWAEFHFGDADFAPKFKVELDTPEDKEAKARLLQSVGQSIQALLAAGVPVDAIKLCESLGVPIKDGQEERAPITQLQVGAGAVTVNEVRASIGLSKIKDGDKIAGLSTQNPLGFNQREYSFESQGEAFGGRSDGSFGNHRGAFGDASQGQESAHDGTELVELDVVKPKKQVPESLAERRAKALDGVKRMDSLVHHSRAEASRLLAPEISAITATIQGAKSIEEIKEKLVRDYAASSSKSLKEHMSKVILAATVTGVNSQK